MMQSTPRKDSSQCQYLTDIRSKHVRVVHAIVENVEREGSGDDAISDSRWEKNVGQLGKRCFENKEEQWGHDKP